MLFSRRYWFRVAAIFAGIVNLPLPLSRARPSIAQLVIPLTSATSLWGSCGSRRSGDLLRPWRSLWLCHHRHSIPAKSVLPPRATPMTGCWTWRPVPTRRNPTSRTRPPSFDRGRVGHACFDWELGRVIRVWSLDGGGRLFYIARPSSVQIRTYVDLLIPTCFRPVRPVVARLLLA